MGVAPIPGLDGGESSFVGGDVLGIAATSKHTSAAWNFIAWTLSDEAQVKVAAKAGYIPSRSDLADNQYAQKDPRLVTFNKLVGKGQTPATVNFGPTYNDPNGPVAGVGARGDLRRRPEVRARQAQRRDQHDAAGRRLIRARECR